MDETADRTCPACRKEVDGTDELESLGDLRGWDRQGQLRMPCPHCGAALVIQEEDVCRGDACWTNYYIRIAADTSHDV